MRVTMEGLIDSPLTGNYKLGNESAYSVNFDENVLIITRSLFVGNDSCSTKTTSTFWLEIKTIILQV